MLFQKTDILILGAGLAGLRAAWAALEEDPKCQVTIVSTKEGPSGSSFANLNNALGMQVLITDYDKENFCQEVLDLAAPAYVRPQLIQILAEESAECFFELRDVGFKFKKNQMDQIKFFTGCFSPEHRRAAVFTDLAAAFFCLEQKVKQLGAKFLTGWSVNKILSEPVNGQENIPGAFLCSTQEEQYMAVQAKTVILALGGPAPLFAFHQAGPGNPGFSYALMQEAGITTINESFIQVMWAALPDKKFWPLANLAQAGCKIRTADQEIITVPDYIRNLSSQRSTHCPAGYGLEDYAMDKFLVNNLHEPGYVEIFSPKTGGKWIKVAPMAHAGNGGALIDQDGQTDKKSIFACGECAGGMHGANRIGGAMVTATQVFGKKCGQKAVKTARGSSFLSDRSFTNLINEKLDTLPCKSFEYKQRLKDKIRQKLQKSLLNTNQKSLESILQELNHQLGNEANIQDRLQIESARLIIKNALKIIN
jgi:L-aspartate oxidase